MERKIWVLVVAMIITVAFLTGCGKQGGAKASVDSSEKVASTEVGEPTLTDASTFYVAINYMPPNLQPYLGNDDFTTMLRPIYESLYAVNKEGIEFYLAESLDISADGKEYTIRMNPNATWSDGKPITVEDVIFTIEYETYKVGGSSLYDSVNGVKAKFTKIDDLTLKIELPESYASYASAIGDLILLPAHVTDGDATKVDESDYFTKPGMATSGAYTVAEINDDSLVYKSRSDYYRGVPQVNTVVMKTIGVGSTKQVAFENGEISYNRITTAEELEKYESMPEKYNVSSMPEGRLNYLQINPHGPFQFSEDARKAIAFALNGQELIDGAYGSDKLASPANSLLTPENTYYNPENKGYVQNLEEAKKLAKSSGLEGQTLVYIYNADRPNMESVAVVIQQQLAQIGVNLSIEGLDSTTFFNRFFAMYYGTGLETTWDLGTNGWDSMRGNTLCQSYSYVSPDREMWGLSEASSQTAINSNKAITPEDTKAAQYQFQATTLKEYWIYPISYTNYVMASHKNVTGLDTKAIVPEFIDYLEIKVE